MQLKQHDISDLKLKQLKYETGTWKRSLEFMIDENIRLKNRLSDVLKDPFDNKLLEQLDHFQGRFVRQDALIDFLRNDLRDLETLLAKEIGEKEHATTIAQDKLKTLGKFIVSANCYFDRLKLDFNHYLSDNL